MKERELVQNYFETAPIKLIRLKTQAILMWEGDLKIKDIAMSQIRPERTIERWIQDFMKKRMASLFSGLVGNENAAKHQKTPEKMKPLGIPQLRYGKVLSAGQNDINLRKRIPICIILGWTLISQPWILP
jgi:hypothetical protein